ncbi:class I SAM-dependent methyltransferase [Candidatus Berkelbacteria bacterium]|nr:class I SAM-dependent methyltransferase [Candidatus Berkelbacteria bacterium]
MRSIRSMLLARSYDRAMRRSEAGYLGRWRRALLATIRGEVLELGAGTGVNLQHYPRAVSRLVLAEPNDEMRHRLTERIARSGRRRILVDGSGAEMIGFGDAAFDAVVCTLVLCSVRDQAVTLSEARRVLRPGGRLYVLEHVLASESQLARWQRVAEPVWRFFSHNCHLTRNTAEAIVRTGFQWERFEALHAPSGPVFTRAFIRGVATK